MDLEYIKLLMLYSDQQYPFKKAKADPGLGESVRNVNRYMDKHGNARKLDNGEANRILLSEKTANRMVRDIDEDYTPKAEKSLSNIETGLNKPPESNLENELLRLKEIVKEKEAELQRMRSGTTPPLKGGVTPTEGGIVERKLEDTGYSDKISKIE
jgi:hypothetical protein